MQQPLPIDVAAQFYFSTDDLPVSDSWSHQRHCTKRRTRPQHTVFYRLTIALSPIQEWADCARSS